jgi:hypothetical protein
MSGVDGVPVITRYLRGGKYDTLFGEVVSAAADDARSSPDAGSLTGIN